MRQEHEQVRLPPYAYAAYNDTGVNPYDDPDACKEYYGFTEEASSDAKDNLTNVPPHPKLVPLGFPTIVNDATSDDDDETFA
ncbi:hypothetical protein AAVH_42149 [Aphelenchoides avenae]|nr:hypothetical protein AAVH_42149 [Aphelenchus avenae]